MPVNDLVDGTEMTTPSGHVSVRRVRPGVLFMVQRGFLSKPFHLAIIGELDRAIVESSPVTMYVDAWDFDGYEPTYRIAWTDWFRRNKPNLSMFPFLVRSMLVQLGMQAVNTATGGVMRPIHSPDEFDRILRQANIPPERYCAPRIRR